MTKYQVLNYFIAVVWIINGLFCKLLDLVPRHRQIVARILGPSDPGTLTIMIGFAELIMAVWILSGYRSKLNAFVQILVIVTMNIIEFIMAPDLLLWGRFNLIFALLFVLLIFYNEFYIRNKSARGA